jgi:ferredoxin
MSFRKTEITFINNLTGKTTILFEKNTRTIISRTNKEYSRTYPEYKSGEWLKENNYLEIRASCDGCGICVDECPEQKISLGPNSASKNSESLSESAWFTGDCSGCGICTVICPVDAIRFL